MRKRTGFVAVLALVSMASMGSLVSCGDDGGDDDDDDTVGDGGGDVDAASDVDAVASDLVPDPGDDPIPFSWPDTEPNDRPSQAVPVGTSISGFEATWFDGTEKSGQVGGDDERDYFVFRSSAQGGMFHNTPCWNTRDAADLLDFYVYQVDDGLVGEQVAASEETGAGCENIGSTADFEMAASTVYLVEMRAKGQDSAIYSA